MGPNHLRFAQPRLLLAGLLSLIGFGVLTSGAMAQDEVDPDTTTLTASVLTCLEPGCTEQLDLTEPADGVALEVTDTDTGDVLGACTTGDTEAGACGVEIPWVDSVTISIDESTVPEGFAPTENPGVLTLENDPENHPAYGFLLFPDGGFPEDSDAAATPGGTGGEVSDLPSTGMQASTPVAELPVTGMQASTPVAELPVTGMQAATPVGELPATGSGSGGSSDTALVAGVTIATMLLGLGAFAVRQVVSGSRG